MSELVSTSEVTLSRLTLTVLAPHRCEGSRYSFSDNLSGSPGLVIGFSGRAWPPRAPLYQL